MRGHFHVDVGVDVGDSEKQRVHLKITSHSSHGGLVRCEHNGDDRSTFW